MEINTDGAYGVGVYNESRYRRRRRLRIEALNFRRAVQIENDIFRAPNPEVVRRRLLQVAERPPQRMFTRVSMTILLWIAIVWLIAFWVSYAQGACKSSKIIIFHLSKPSLMIYN